MVKGQRDGTCAGEDAGVGGDRSAEKMLLQTMFQGLTSLIPVQTSLSSVAQAWPIFVSSSVLL